MDIINSDDCVRQQSVLVHVLIPLDIFEGPEEPSTIGRTGGCETLGQIGTGQGPKAVGENNSRLLYSRS